jgi:hypothetical protein
MKMIAHHHQEQVRLTIDKRLTIPVMAIIRKSSSQILFYFQTNKCKQELEHKTHLRYKGRLEAFNEVLQIIKNKKEIDYEKDFNNDVFHLLKDMMLGK